MNVYIFANQRPYRCAIPGGLLDYVPEFSGLEGQIDRLLGYSIRDACSSDRVAELEDMAYSQPRLYAMNAARYHREVALAGGPIAVAGYGLGEYNALYAAGVFDFVTGLHILVKRGNLMRQVTNGAMAAVVGLTPNKVLEIIRTNRELDLELASYDSSRHSTVSGPAVDIVRAGPIMRRAGAKMYIRLLARGPLHSRYMIPAAKEFDHFLAGIEFGSPKLMVVSSVTAEPYGENDPTSIIRTVLVEQLFRPIMWMQCAAYLMKQGFSRWIEIGDGSVRRFIGDLEMS